VPVEWTEPGADDMTLDPRFLSSTILVLSGFAAAFLAALWVALVIWTYRDIRTRIRDRFVHILAAVLVALLNLPGLIVYLVLRPPRTLDEEYQRRRSPATIDRRSEPLPGMRTAHSRRLDHLSNLPDEVEETLS
jgi:hypothetical protein